MDIRPATEDDIRGYARVQEAEWAGSIAAAEEQIWSRVKVFPEGVLIAVHDNKVVAGTTAIKLTNYRVDDGLSWSSLCDDGWCTNHDPEGEVMFGVDLSVSRNAPRSTSSRMFYHLMLLVARQGVEAFYWGSRMPRYHRHADSMSAEEYSQARNSRGRLIDPELEIYSRVPGMELVGVTPNYFPDPESLDYGAIMRWSNPIRRYRFLSPLAGPIVRRQYRRHQAHKPHSPPTN